MSLSCCLFLVVFVILYLPIRPDSVSVENAYKLSPREKHVAHKAIVDKDFLRADSNKDGKLSPDEFPSRDSTTFDNMKAFFKNDVDKNGDGFVTLAEINKAIKNDEDRQVQAEWDSILQSYDRNADNALQMDELEEAGVRQSFGVIVNSSEIIRRFDADHNGQIDIYEVNLREYSKSSFHEGNAAEQKEKFKRSDKNKDGKLSFREFNIPAFSNDSDGDDESFSDYDENEDGFVTRKEYDARLKIEKINIATDNINVYDTNDDQKLAKNETTTLLVAYLSPEYKTFNFAKFDTDHDGGLNAEELVSLTEKIKMNDLEYGGGD